MSEIHTELKLLGTTKTKLVNSEEVASQLQLSREKFMKLLSQKLGVQCFLTVNGEELIIPGRWTDLKIIQEQPDFTVSTKHESNTLLQFILKMNKQSDCFPLEEDEDKFIEVKAACEEKSLQEVIQLVDNLDIVDTSLPEWQVLQLALQ